MANNRTSTLIHTCRFLSGECLHAFSHQSGKNWIQNEVLNVYETGLTPNGLLYNSTFNFNHNAIKLPLALYLRGWEQRADKKLYRTVVRADLPSLSEPLVASASEKTTFIMEVSKSSSAIN